MKDAEQTPRCFGLLEHGRMKSNDFSKSSIPELELLVPFD